MSHNGYYLFALKKYNEDKNKFVIKDGLDFEKYLTYVEDGNNYINEKQMDKLKNIIDINNAYLNIKTQIDIVLKNIQELDSSKKAPLENKYFELLTKANTCEYPKFLNKFIDSINKFYKLPERKLEISKLSNNNIYELYNDIIEISGDIKDLNDYIINEEDYFEIKKDDLNRYTKQKLCLKKLKNQLYKNQNELLNNFNNLQKLHYEVINKLFSLLYID